MENLVIVESPAKARTLSRFLGDGYRVEASFGHLIDLPKSKIGIDVDDNFEPQYFVMADKGKRVGELSNLAKTAKHLFLATDPDREGEAIAWHLLNVFSNTAKDSPTSSKLRGAGKKGTKNEGEALKTMQAKDITLPYERVVFHEITQGAVQEAFDHPRKIDDNLVNAQQARRVLDRVVGYKLSPLLWRKVRIGLSAGRVQSVALRLIADREREILAFVPVEYWSIAVELSKKLQKGSKLLEQFTAFLVEKDGKKIEIGNKETADGILKDLDSRNYVVKDVREKQAKRSPSPAFTTSTMQQQAANKLGFTAKKTMKLAQDLYEEGYITYMRTDSVVLSQTALNQSRDFIAKNYGNDYLPPRARFYTTKSKVAQEAHEAIRPTNVNTNLQTIQKLGKDHLRLYDLIWKRLIASQMADALYDQTTVDVAAVKGSTFNQNATAAKGGTLESSYLFRANGSRIKFAGWLLAYTVGQKNVKKQGDEGSIEEEDLPFEDKILPQLSVEEPLDLQKIIPEQHFTQPPPRYNEASLIKALEANDIGRPSTYAPIISTILDRRYVEKIERKLIPTAVGFAVNDFLVKNFPDILDIAFTAQMEGKLDEVAEGKEDWVQMMKTFYKPFDKKVGDVQEKSERVKIAVEETDEKCPKCGKNLVIRTGRFGKFLGCSGFPECDYKASLAQKVGMKCPDCKDGDVIVKRTKRGRIFYGCSNYPKCTYASWNDPSQPSKGKEKEAATS